MELQCSRRAFFLSITKPAKLRNTGGCYIFVDILK